VAAVGRRTGRAELDEHAEGVHSSEIEVELKGGDDPRAKDALVADIRRRLAVLPVSQAVGDAPQRIQVLAVDLEGDLGAHAGQHVIKPVRDIPGLTDLQVEKQVRIPQLEIRVDYTRAALYGVQPAAVVEQISQPEGVSSSKSPRPVVVR
jgi:Cu/Ag efflux pump CusA